MMVKLKRDPWAVLQKRFLDLMYAETVEAQLAPIVLLEGAIVAFVDLGLISEERGERLQVLSGKLVGKYRM